MIENNFTPMNISPSQLNSNSNELEINNMTTLPTKPKVPNRYKKRVQCVFTYEEYIKNNIILEKYTMPILKQVCKNYKLGVTGRKPEIIKKLTTYFCQIGHSITLQKYIRRYIVNTVTISIKKSKKMLSECVNDTDFSTLDSLNEIDPKFLYCYKDTDNFTYGFHIASLIELLRTTDRLRNPYNRMPITRQQTNNIIAVYNLSVRFIPSFKMSGMVSYMSITSIVRYNAQTQLMHRLQQYRVAHRPINRYPSSYNNYHPTLTSIIEPDEYPRYQQIVTIRELPLHTRINQLFMEIDQLGNYTQSTWFTELTHLEYARLYRTLYDIWNYRGQLHHTLKQNICPFHGPFDGIFPHAVRHLDLSIDELKRACLIVLENMTYSGINTEIKQIGVMHALSALTIVSGPARDALPWLYESVAF